MDEPYGWERCCFVAERAKELSEQARSTAKELGEKAKDIWRKVSE